jgi:hypothetical protein
LKIGDVKEDREGTKKGKITNPKESNKYATPTQMITPSSLMNTLTTSSSSTSTSSLGGCRT